MIKLVSKVLYSNKEDKALMRKECERVVESPVKQYQLRQPRLNSIKKIDLKSFIE